MQEPIGTKMAEVKIDTEFDGGTDWTSKEFLSATFMDNIKKLIVLKKKSSFICIYTWDGNLFPSPQLSKMKDLKEFISDSSGDNYNIKIVPVSDEEALIQNDTELLLVNFSASIPTVAKQGI